MCVADTSGKRGPGRQIVRLATRMTLLSCAVFTLLTGASIAPALPAIQARFASEPHAELLTKLVLSISPLFIALGGPLWGLVIDRWGRKTVLVVSIVGTAAFGLAGSFMGSLEALIGCRALLGLAVSGVTNASYTLVIDYFDGTERERFLGFQAAVQKMGGLAFVLIGGLLAAISWRTTFAVDAIALLVLPGVLLAIREPASRLGKDQHRDASDPMPWRAVSLIWFVGFVGQAIFYTIPTQIPFLLTQHFQATPQLVALAVAASTLFSAITATLYHRLRSRFSYQSILGMTFGLVACSFFVMAHALTQEEIIAGLALGGTGFGLLLPNVSVWLADCTPQALRGRAVGIMMSGIFLGQFSSPLLAQPVVSRFGINRLFTVIAIGTALVAILCELYVLCSWLRTTRVRNAR